METKIAYGLARIGIEAFGCESVSIKDEGGFYAIDFNVDESNESNRDKVEKTFNLFCRRLVSSNQILNNSPGITSRSAERLLKLLKEENYKLLSLTRKPVLHKQNMKNENICQHEFNGTGNIIGFTAFTSYHHGRDVINTDTVTGGVPRRPTNPKKICIQCALLSLLGTWFASFIFKIKTRDVVVLPIPQNKVEGEKLLQIFSLQHRIRKMWFNWEIPQVLIPLLFLSKLPSAADILNDFELFIAVLSRQQGYHVDGVFLIPINNYLNFIQATPYNIAVLEILFKNEAYGALQALNSLIYHLDATLVGRFVRLYAQETSFKWGNKVNLLYPETAKYLLKEVGMIRHDIITNPALRSVVNTLRYFVRQSKYWYVDNIRNAKRDARDFETTLSKMMREGWLRKTQGENIHVPREKDIQELFRLAEEDFESTKLALAILAFSFKDKTEETVENIKEV
ncbi:MAG: type I-A CRISPR-associated protein Csa5 [candidate division WOR-3 bacterium]|nr:type I-A CRISPR-associated protein Csa5 [candidate division WOR-3 bacterium]